MEKVWSMVIRSIQVPRELLLDQGLTNSAKLIWICLEICRRNGQAMESPKLLEARTGYSRHTVLAALANLRDRGWLRPIPVYGQVVMPDDLVLDSRLQASAKMLFGALQLTPQFRDDAGVHPRRSCHPHWYERQHRNQEPVGTGRSRVD